VGSSEIHCLKEARTSRDENRERVSLGTRIFDRGKLRDVAVVPAWLGLLADTAVGRCGVGGPWVAGDKIVLGRAGGSVGGIVRFDRIAFGITVWPDAVGRLNRLLHSDPDASFVSPIRTVSFCLSSEKFPASRRST